VHSARNEIGTASVLRTEIFCSTFNAVRIRVAARNPPLGSVEAFRQWGEVSHERFASKSDWPYWRYQQDAITLETQVGRGMKPKAGSQRVGYDNFLVAGWYRAPQLV